MGRSPPTRPNDHAGSYPVNQITRRQFLYTSAAATLASRTLAQPTTHQLLVGTQTLTGTSKGIYNYSFQDGVLTAQGLATESENPTFLALSPNRRTLLVANELDNYGGKSSGEISSYSINRDKTLTLINDVASRGTGPCHVAFDHTGRSAFAANYGGGSAASFSVSPDGHLSSAVSFFQYTGSGPDPARQKAPHAHRVTVSPDNRFLLVNDLGLDCIHIYHLDPATAKLTPNEPDAWHSTPGSGPRALQFHPNGRVAYCVTEMSSSVVVLRWNAQPGVLETIQQLPMRPPDFQGTTGGDDIVLDPHARFAYATDRFDDIIVTFAISPTDGTLTLLNRIPCGGKVPRHLTLDPTGQWLLVANQASDNIAIFNRNPQTGQLTPTKTTPISLPQCLLFL
jgi:6-phosphogluconolactonase